MRMKAKIFEQPTLMAKGFEFFKEEADYARVLRVMVVNKEEQLFIIDESDIWKLDIVEPYGHYVQLLHRLKDKIKLVKEWDWE